MANKRKMKSLKNYKKLSSLLELALDDLAKQEQLAARPNAACKVNMLKWWVPNEKNGGESHVCTVCLAGSVMKFSLNRPPLIGEKEVSEFHPEHYDSLTQDRLFALNCLREGDIRSAAECIGIETVLGSQDVTAYETDHKQWRKDMRQLVRDLKKAGE